ncbi:MAG: SDR family oxidoreductase [Nitrospirae bacterium]|nr:SDR family oxidoreductase [Nitrospirota bacterium]
MIFPDKFQLKGKVALVTGGAGLIGKYICMALAQAYANVYIGDVDVEQSNKVVMELTSYGLPVRFVPLDISSELSVDSAVGEIIQKAQKIDILINNAYPRTSDWGEKFEGIKFESLRKNVDMHMNGYFLCCQKVLNEMKKTQEGVVVNISSTYGVVAPNFSIYEDTDMTMPAAYSLIKGGIISFTRYLSTYFSRYNIRVNVLCPGGVFDNQNPVFVKKYENLTPMGKMANPEDVAAPVLFLCSDASAYITGQVIIVDGGFTTW